LLVRMREEVDDMTKVRADVLGSAADSADRSIMAVMVANTPEDDQ
jgi:hypothetical protein